jgi:hypothetical protein
VESDGSHQETFQEEIRKLPECRNDPEYGFVNGMCGYKRVSGVYDLNGKGKPIL